jgi:exopolysaccharide biosynthesis polyprenyl glycosylphosphotransferase
MFFARPSREKTAAAPPERSGGAAFRVWNPHGAAWLCDLLALLAAYGTTLFLRFHGGWGHDLFNVASRSLGLGPLADLSDDLARYYVVSAPRILLQVAIVLGLLYALGGLYSGRRFLKPPPVAAPLALANGLALLIFYAYWYLQRNIFHPRSFFFIMLGLNTAYGILLRAACRRLFAWLHRVGKLEPRHALLVGGGADYHSLNDFLEERRPHGILVAGRYLLEESADLEQALPEIRRQAQQLRVQHLVVARRTLVIGEIMRFLELAQELRCATHVLSDKLDVIVHRARMEADLFARGAMLYFAAPQPHAARPARAWRVASRILAALLLAALAPLFLLIVLAVKLTDRGPVFFFQERIGFDHRPFRICKFRTMHAQAEAGLAEIEGGNEAGGAIFKMRHDPRVTKIGRLLRRLSLDELPQLINVVKGEMALVGPRPLPRRDYENYYEKWHYGRHAGLPGITCLWQVSGRSRLPFEDMCLLDIYYLRNRNWILDLQILLRTVYAVISAEGAY